MDNATTPLPDCHSHAETSVESVCRKQRFSALKDKVAVAEQVQVEQISCDLPALDFALGGGLRYGGVHLVSRATDMQGQSSDSHLPCTVNGAVTGFVLALLRKVMLHYPDRPVIWCASPHAGMTGSLSAEGIRQVGIDPAQLIFVHDPHPVRCMSAFEETLQTDGLAAVIGEYGLLCRQSGLWQRWARRTRRAARTSGTIGILLGPPASACGFETGWHIRPFATSLSDIYDWRPSWQVSLHYTKGGQSAHAITKWDWVTARFLPESSSENMSVTRYDTPDRQIVRQAFTASHPHAMPVSLSR